MILPNYPHSRNIQNTAAGFSILEVIASVIVLSVGVLAALRMQITAISTNRAPVANQEIATIARRALEEGVAGTQTINGYTVVVVTQDRCFTGTNLGVCPAGTPAHVQRIETTVTSQVDNIEFVAETFRAN